MVYSAVALNTKTALIFLLAPLVVGCSSNPVAAPAPVGPQPNPGETCDAQNAAPLKVHFDPPALVLAPGQTRPVRMIVDPDVCTPTQATFATANGAIASPPMSGSFDLRHATYDFNVTANALGTTTITATMVRAFDGTMVNSALPVEVRSGNAPTCAPGSPATATLSASNSILKGPGDLANAALSIPVLAFTETVELPAVPTFPAEIGCDSDLTAAAPGAPIALGPAVSFVAKAPLGMGKSLRREIDFAIPVNPAAMPQPGRMRHLQVLFHSPMVKGSRVVPVANPRIEKAEGSDGYVLKFSSPWFGTYQAAAASDAGSIHHTRHLTHRAVIGFSMGAGGAASFGTRYHNRFDAIAPLGGPTDWTFLLSNIENLLTQSFCPAGSPSCTKYAPNAYPTNEPLFHTEDFDHFWYQEGGGNGGHFPRSEYIQLLTDLSLMRGNPFGGNSHPEIAYAAAGPAPTDPWIHGDTTGLNLPAGVDCRFVVDPISRDSASDQQTKIQKQCNTSRCAPANAYIAPTNYFDRNFNPDGTKQVVSFCDGGQNGVSPYVDTFVPPTPDEAFPVDFTMAVDLNKNGLRDLGEPVIVAGHEPFTDTGVDGLADASEPGYDAVTNPDPNQDDYEPQINPDGTENDHRHEAGEPYLDYGLDGVINTASRHVGGDVGELDGKFTESDGLRNWYEIDPHSLIHQLVSNVPGGKFDDDAFTRFDVLTDGGVRDLFNFGAVARHLGGAIASRKRANGRQIKSTAYFNNFEYLPGEDIKQPNNYVPADIRWADVPDAPSIRYGNVDATPLQIMQGDGMHVGTAAQLLYRLETSFYFVAQRWPDADRTLTETTANNPESDTQNELGPTCEVSGRCEKIFTGPKTGRTGPIAVTLPPGYALAENRTRDVRYPVVFVLHGYGQDPRDLEAVALITNNFMNDGQRSYATRLPKFIVVYVDGRCRVLPNGKPECIRGTFYLDSVRPDGPKLESWFDEVIDYVDHNYRTMPASDVDVLE